MTLRARRRRVAGRGQKQSLPRARRVEVRQDYDWDSKLNSGLDSRLDFGQDADLEFDIQVGSLNKRVRFWGRVGFG